MQEIQDKKNVFILFIVLGISKRNISSPLGILIALKSWGNNVFHNPSFGRGGNSSSSS
jgi:hypothetical protein